MGEEPVQASAAAIAAGGARRRADPTTKTPLVADTPARHPAAARRPCPRRRQWAAARRWRSDRRSTAASVSTEPIELILLRRLQKRRSSRRLGFRP